MADESKHTEMADKTKHMEMADETKHMEMADETKHMEMADETKHMESTAFGTVSFEVTYASGDRKKIVIDVGLRSPHIGGHKQDLAEMYDFKGKVQTWIYKGETLEDEKSLWDYGIYGQDTIAIKINIS